MLMTTINGFLLRVCFSMFIQNVPLYDADNRSYLHSALKITDFRYYLLNPRGPYIELALLGELEKKTNGK